MSAIKSGRLVDPETEESISDVETTLNRLGIALRDSDGQFRNLGEVLDEVGERWKTFGSTSQRAIATAFAGTRQQTRFLALMAGWDQASKYAEEAANSTGLAAEKLEIYRESLAAKQAKFTASFEAFSQTMLNSGLVAFVYDAGAGFLNLAAGINPAIASFIELTAVIAGATVAFNALKVSSFGSSIKKIGSDLGWPKKTGDIVPIYGKKQCNRAVTSHSDAGL